MALAVPACGAERRQREYRAAAYGLPVGKINLDLFVAADGAAAAVQLHTAGIADLVEPTALAARAEAAWEAGQIRWQAYTLDHVYAAKRRITWMQRRGEQVHTVITPRYRLWGTPPADAASIAVANDPLSSLMGLAVAVGKSKACSARQLVFDGKQLYSLEVLALSGKRARRAALSGPLEGAQMRCALRYSPLRGFDPEDVPRKPIRDADIWFAFPGAGDLAVPVRLRVRQPLGALDIRLARASRAEILIDTEAPQAPSAVAETAQ